MTKPKKRTTRKRGRSVLGWWFCATDRLPHGDGRPVRVGETHAIEGEIVPCERGLHASKTVWDAIRYANGNILYRVRLSGIVEPHGNPTDKYAASKRTYLARIDAEPILRAFARRCALDVIDKWDAPEVVRKYLETGDEALRYAAWDAARDAAIKKYSKWLQKMCLEAVNKGR